MDQEHMQPGLAITIKERQNGNAKGAWALTLKNFDAGSVKTWVRVAASHPNWQEATVTAPEWTVLVQIIKDNLDEMDCRCATRPKTADRPHLHPLERRCNRSICSRESMTVHATIG